jgi:hypothetical protein
MNQFERALSKAEEEKAEDDTVPELHIVARANGAAKKESLPAPLRFPSPRPSRLARPEMAVLGWEPRERRLQGGN